ncbi:hypothetical protein HK102_010200, partial [Quaeritorhiza haematococci]
MRTPGYEADLNRIVLYDRTSDTTTSSKKEREGKILTPHWDRSPESLTWSSTSTSLYTKAQEFGHLKIFEIDVPSGDVEDIVGEWENSGIEFVDPKKEDDVGVGEPFLVFLRSTPMAPGEIFTLRIRDEDLDLRVKRGEDDGNRPEQRSWVNYEHLTQVLTSEPEPFWFKGHNNEPVMGFIYKPVLFHVQNQYPLAFLIHGGPESSWDTGFSYRWNPQVYAGAGYVAVAINFHGSTGYGGKFTRSILKNWGGAPYKGLDFVLEKYTYVDENRVCALGASYGGYMINWINGQTDRFSCLVNHDGMFDTRAAYYETEELWFPEFE